MKHLIESLGIPHTEVGRIHSPEGDLNLGYIVLEGDRITVLPADDPADDARFLLDNHCAAILPEWREKLWDR